MAHANSTTPAAPAPHWQVAQLLCCVAKEREHRVVHVADIAQVVKARFLELVAAFARQGHRRLQGIDGDRPNPSSAAAVVTKVLQLRPHGEQNHGVAEWVARLRATSRAHTPWKKPTHAWSSRGSSCGGAGTAASARELPTRLLHIAISAQGTGETPALSATGTSFLVAAAPKDSFP